MILTRSSAWALFHKGCDSMVERFFISVSGHDDILREHPSRHLQLLVS